MRRYRKWLLLAGAVPLLWYGIWSWIMAADVARVKASIAHHNQAMKEYHSAIVLKAEAVEADGFPFAFRVAVVRPTFTMIEWKDTYAMSCAKLVLTRQGAGRYQLQMPAEIEALYATDGAAPEQYQVVADHWPAVSLRAADGATGPFTEYAAHMPARVMLTMRLQEKSRTVPFHFSPQPADMFAPIPDEKMASVLGIFVGVMREALVFNTPGGEESPR